MHDRHRRLSYVLFTCVAVELFALPAAAQVEAVVGEPFGVAQVRVPFPSEDVGLPASRANFVLSGPEGRVFYPAISSGVLKRILGGGAPPPTNLTVMFLFRGSQPFEVTVGTPTPQKVLVTPQKRAAVAHARILKRWWRYYNGLFQDLARESAHPPIVETYLTSMLARRLDLAAPLIERLATDTRKSEGRQTWELLTGAEAVRLEVLQATSLGVLPPPQEADLPLPQEVAWRTSTLPAIADDVVIEPMALRVPAECFYVRFGQYSNFLWLNALIEDYGGEIGNMLAARGYRTEINQRVQDQLAMEQGVLAELLGPQAIADVAMIGMDTFTREGAAIGAIFEATGTLLGVDLVRQRHDALFREKDHGASMETVRIAGRDVSFLSTPDNRLRSYYVVDGKYHLVTNSNRIVERFLATGQGERPLGSNDEFRYARSVVPTSRDDTIFIYFSSHFFRSLLSPHYQVELQRRMQAATDIELISLARPAARAEGVAGQSIDDLVRAQLLPDGFGRRPDGSHAVVSDSRIVDSLRGARGHFTPVPDVACNRVTAAERDRYVAQAAYYAEKWQHVDPVLVAIKRYALDNKGGERIAVDAFITPMDDFKYQVLMSALGEPSRHRLVPPEDSVISIDAAVRGGRWFPNIPPHRLFIGLQDHLPLARPRSTDVLKLLPSLRTAPGYLGAWPKPGFLDLLPFGLSGTTDDEGFSQLPLGLTRWQGRGFSVLSRDEKILTDASRQLGFVEEDEPAQIRVQVRDVSKAKFVGWLNAMGHERARQISVANARFISILTQQLQIPPADARQVAEELLDAKLVCALGGEYELVQQGEARIWRSTAWPESTNFDLPADYMTPPLDWFRGLEARLVKYPDRLVIRGSIDMQRKQREPLFQLPFFGPSPAPDQGTEQEEKKPGEN